MICRFEWTILLLAITTLCFKHEADVDSLKVLEISFDTTSDHVYYEYVGSGLQAIAKDSAAVAELQKGLLAPFDSENCTFIICE